MSNASATTTRVDGISDESMTGWDGHFSSSYFANYFRENWLGHIHYSRWVAQWNAMDGSGEAEREDYVRYRRRFEEWLNDASSLGLTLDLSLTSYTGVFPSSSATYKAGLKELLNQAIAQGHPITYLEPWNEPNQQGEVSAVAAAHFANEAKVACQEVAVHCTVIAGNFEDQGNAPEYIKEYREALNFSPTNWGVHPYVSVQREEEKWYKAVKEALPAEAHIWFTEIAARKCGKTFNNEESGQDVKASWLVDALIHNAHPEHVFYYSFMLGEGKTPNCSAETDSALYVPNPGDPEVPDRPRAAASVIMGNTDFPMGYTESATPFVSSGETELHGAVFPNEEPTAHYKFEYGTSTAYGSSTATGSLTGGFPDNEQKVSARIAGLSKGGTYHYRIVAWNGEGTNYGADRTFTLGASSSSSRWALENSQGNNMNAFFGNTSGQLADEYWTAAKGWVELPSGLVSGISAPPTAIENFESNNINVFYENTSGQLVDEYWTPGGGWSPSASFLASGISGTPTATENTAGNNINVFYENTSGQLVDEYWTAAEGWAKSPLVLASGINGTPAAIENPEGNNMNVFYENTSGQLVDEYWTAAEGWAKSPLVLASGINGTPTATENAQGNNMNVFYENTSGQLVDEYWTAAENWAKSPLVLTSGINGTPTAVENNAGNNINVFYEDTSGQLIDKYWTSTENWANSPVVLTSGIAGIPAAVENPEGNNINVFFRNTAGQLVDEYWTPIGGWSPSAAFLANGMVGP